MPRPKTKKAHHGLRKFKPTNKKQVRPQNPTAKSEDKNSFDAETFSVLAAFEWMALAEEDKEKLLSAGIADQEAFIDVRIGMRHASSQELLGWADQRGIGYVRTSHDLRKYFMDHVEGLKFKCMHVEFTQGIDLIEQYKMQTRSLKITSGIPSITLPSGNRYYYSPYQKHTPQRALWLLSAYTKVFTPTTSKRR